MHFGVPQFVDIEDKIAFRLTAKQLGWFALGGAILFLVWNFFEKPVFVASLFIVGGLSTAFAFFRPYGVSFFTFLVNGAMFSIRPKVVYWSKNPERDEKEEKKKEKPEVVKEEEFMPPGKEETYKKLEEIAKVLDEKSDLKK